jgi:hypothetical protein
MHILISSDMASETNPFCKPSLGERPHQILVPSRSSSISRNICTGNPRTLGQVASAASSGGSSLPQRTTPSTTARHSQATGDRVSSYLPTDDIKRRHLNSTRTTQRSASCPATTRKSMHPSRIQRWSGLTRTVSDWDHGLRRVCGSYRVFENVLTVLQGSGVVV